MKHTPGPWIAGHMTAPDHSCSCRYILSEGYMGSIAVVSTRTTDETGCNDSPPEDEAVANAKLIAAAPSLAEALKRSLCDIRDMEVYRSAIKALQVAGIEL